MRVVRKLDVLVHAQILNNLGLCYLSLTEYERARAYFIRALAEQRKLPDIVRIRINLGRTYMLEGRLALAQTTLYRTLVEARIQGSRELIADTLNNLGQNFWRRHLPDQAQLALNEALAIDESIGDKRGQSSALHYLGLSAGDLHERGTSPSGPSPARRR